MKNIRNLLSLLTLSLVFAAPLSAQTPPPAGKSAGAGKVFIINLEQGQQFLSYVVRDLRTCSVESLVFLCGVQLEDNWLAGRKVMIPNAAIKSLYEFDSLDEYRASVKQAQEAAAKVQTK